MVAENPVTFRVDGNIGVITIDNPPVNALSSAVRTGLTAAIKQAASADISACLLTCAGRTFIAGADISEFDHDDVELDFNPTLAAIENSAIPVIAVLHGNVLGGGLETAMACHYRIAHPATRLGQPEVNLGLIPGAGGTQRLPRLIDVQKALDMIVTGKPVKAAEAHALGLVDAVITGDLAEGAVEFAKNLIATGAAARRSCDQAVKGDAPSDFFDAYRAETAKRTRGYLAPVACVDAVRAAMLPFEEGLARETELFIACLKSPQSKAQRHVFFGERTVRKIPGVARDTPLRDINSAGVIGAGTMGAGIAMVFANAGIPVRMLEVNADALERGLGRIRSDYARRVKKGRMSEDKMEQTLSHITGTLDYADLADSDVVVEAVFESMDIKHKVFGELDRVCKPGAILATNTSSLDVDEIAAGTSRPADVIGLHFFSPANIMRLLEIVRGKKTAEDVVATSMKLAQRLRKVGVLSGVCHGFIGNRMLGPYIRETNALLLEGATPEQIDRVLTDFGMAMGPLAVIDLAGVDVNYKIRAAREDLPDDPKYFAVEDKIYAAGRYGQKTGSGFYNYPDGARRGEPDPAVLRMICETADELGVTRRDITDEEILERCLYPLINEGGKILDEGIALRPVDIDIVYVYGYGFPPFRGGPMFYAGQIGYDKVLEGLGKYARQCGDEYGFWAPSKWLTTAAEKSQPVHA